MIRHPSNPSLRRGEPLLDEHEVVVVSERTAPPMPRCDLARALECDACLVHIAQQRGRGHCRPTTAHGINRTDRRRRAFAAPLAVASKRERRAVAADTRVLVSAVDSDGLGVCHAVHERHRHHQLGLDEEEDLLHGKVARHHPAADERVGKLGVHVGGRLLEGTVSQIHRTQRSVAQRPLPRRRPGAVAAALKGEWRVVGEAVRGEHVEVVQEGRR
mmetsp:Transcript_57460/g.131945  ORF Transcript_57460/g.131945 Transcript_57460/m.131945 type:complete len:216 (-) Transcript_57460:45-692(-)